MVLNDPRATIAGRITRVSLLMILAASCDRTAAPPPACLQFSSDLMPDLAGGLIRKDFRIANAWAVKSDKMIDSSGVKFPAYFLSADIIAPNGEAVPGMGHHGNHEARPDLLGFTPGPEVHELGESR